MIIAFSRHTTGQMFWKI